MPAPDPTAVVKHVIELMGGRDRAFEKFDAEYKRFMDVWEQDAGSIGRILRAHLFVEHFLTEYIRSKNSGLGSMEEARLTFAQKVSLVGTGSPEVEDLLPGLRRLNRIRNRLVHTLHAEITNEDVYELLEIGLFRAMREERARRQSQRPSAEPLDVAEDFAMHVGSRLQASVSKYAAVWAEAIRLAQEESSALGST